MIFDENLQPVLNPVFSSGSGARYTREGIANEAAVPEPSSLMLAFSGLALLGAFKYAGEGGGIRKTENDADTLSRGLRDD